MSPKGRGGGRTPEKLVELLNKAINEDKTSVRSISRNTGLGLAPISRYIKGESEPSQASLEKLAAYFGVEVAWLRDEYGVNASYEEAVEFRKRHDAWSQLREDMLKMGLRYPDEFKDMKKYRHLIFNFLKVPLEDMNAAREALLRVQEVVVWSESRRQNK